MKHPYHYHAVTALLLASAMLMTGCGAMDTAQNRPATYDRLEAAGESKADSPELNTEEYRTIRENSFQSTAAQPLSTFSADADTASYTNVRRFIRQDQTVPKDAVRLEEMINYFHYDYPAPESGEPFSVTAEIADCPWNPDTKLMRIGLKTVDIDLSQRRPMNLVFLIDTSGSMDDYDKLPLVQQAFSILTESLSPSDRISIVTYAGSDKVVLEGADGNDGFRIREAINSLSAGGATAGAAGITTAYQIAEKYFIEGGNNHILLATDGDLNVGLSSESALKQLVEEKRENGVFLSVLGFGTGNIKDNKMETLADNGNGSYHYIDGITEARRVLVEQMGGTLVTVAKDVKFQVEFNPAYIKGYRQIGYENRALAAEDFADDSKDAGEIGAGHAVTALYELAFTDSPMQFDSENLKYSDTAALGTENGEYLTVSVRYKQPDGEVSNLLTYPVTEDARTERMTADMQFAAAVTEFGMLLRGSAFKGSASRESVLELAAAGAESGDPYKAEFTELVKRARLP